MRTGRGVPRPVPASEGELSPRKFLADRNATVNTVNAVLPNTRDARSEFSKFFANSCCQTPYYKKKDYARAKSLFEKTIAARPA